MTLHRAPDAMGFAHASTEGLRGDFKILADCLVSLPLALNIDGVWYDRETGRMMRHNHLRCVLRRDYERRGGTLTGSQLQKHIDAIMAGALKATRIRVQTATDTPTVLDVTHEFL